MYNEIVADHFENPRKAGVLKDADVVGQDGVPGQGPYMVLYLHVGDGRITDARFQTYGCPAAIACGSWVTQWAVDKPVEEALTLEPGEVEQGLGGLPLGKEHCAPLAVNALKNALASAAPDDPTG
jgi:NifU-like protein involved in Fe-S cluster formation